jgi:hypothetical protein
LYDRAQFLGYLGPECQGGGPGASAAKLRRRAQDHFRRIDQAQQDRLLHQWMPALRPVHQRAVYWDCRAGRLEQLSTWPVRPPPPPKAQTTRGSSTLTDEEALREGFRRWGADAYVRHRLSDPRLPGRPAWAVGRQAFSLFDVRGQGASWEEAFHDADRRGR